MFFGRSLLSSPLGSGWTGTRIFQTYICDSKGDGLFAIMRNLSVLDGVFVDKVTTGTLAPYLRPDGFRCDVNGISILAMPPGHVELDIQRHGTVINTVPSTPATFSKVKVNSTPVELATAFKSGSAFLPSGTDFVLQCQNHSWECLMEFTDDSFIELVSEQVEDVDLERSDHFSGVDASSGLLAQMAIDHLRQPIADRLYLEGLAIAMTTRAMAFAGPNQKAPSTRGTDKRIDRAVEYIHMYLATGMTVSDLAAVACMAADLWTGAARAQFMGRQAAAISMGGILFLLLEGMLAELSWRAPFLIYLLAFPFGLAAWIILPEKRSSPKAGEGARESLEWRAVAPIAALGFLIMVMFYIIPTRLPFLLIEIGVMGPSSSGLAIAAVTVTSIFSALLFPRLRARFEPLSIFAISYGLMAVSDLLIATATGLGQVILGTLTAGPGLGATMPTKTAC